MPRSDTEKLADARIILAALGVRRIAFLSRPSEPLLESRGYTLDPIALAAWDRLVEGE